MANRRENIVARFIATGTQRFKKETKGVARSIRDVGVEGSHTGEQLEVLKIISGRLERQHETLILIEQRLASELDEVGDQARQAGRDLGFMSLMARRARGGRDSGLLGMLGLTSRWKDKLSLTSAEVKSVALTMGAYLSPALLALGSSFSAAVTGAGIVGGAGLTAFVVGLSGFGLVAHTAAGQIDAVTKAQDAYNLAIAQYGAGSLEASRANARLYAVITANGGRPVWDAVRALTALRQAWTARTGPARMSLFQLLSGGVGVGRRLLPTFARQTNLNAAAVRHAGVGVMEQLGGREMRLNIRVFSRAFRAMFGPLTRGGTNLLFALLRLLRVAAPYAVLFANAFARWTDSIRRRSRDTGRLAGFVDQMVEQTKAWFGLLTAVGRLFLTVFRGSNQQGQALVVTLTNIVNRFNAWLAAVVGPNGQTRVARFFTQFYDSLRLLFSDPQEFGRRFAVFMIQVARAGFWQFVKTWLSLDLASKLFVVAYLFRGAVFGTLGKLAANSFIATFGPRISAAFAAEGVLGARFAGLGTRMGAIWGRAFLAAALTFGVYELAKQTPALSQYSGKKGWGELWKDTKHRLGGIVGGLTHLHAPSFMGGRAGGGNIPWGTAGWVGESGPEVMRATPSGLSIRPMGFGAGPGYGGLRSMEPMLSVSDMLPPLVLINKIDGREISRAVHRFDGSVSSKRGGRPLHG